MKSKSPTERVVLNHLQAFLEQRGVDAILDDFNEDARLFTEAKIYRGKAEIREFFTAFLAGLPPRAIERFSLRGMRVDGNIAQITWSAGDEIPLGTDTFVVDDGKISVQAFAMHAATRS